MLHVAHLNNYKAVEDLGEGWLVWLAAPFLRSKKEKKNCEYCSRNEGKHGVSF